MADRPHGLDLLAIARETLRAQVLPGVAEESRYAALMIANAMAIAARESEFGDGPERDAILRLGHLLGAKRAEDLSSLNKELVHRIRDGDFQPGTSEHAALARHLWECALQQVRISNPKYLERLGLK